uniref:Uncharacterized protein n=1 Tax=Arundo donax TaxID=35708 RepID=A0A0A9C8Z3_ARUDO
MKKGEKWTTYCTICSAEVGNRRSLPRSTPPRWLPPWNVVHVAEAGRGAIVAGAGRGVVIDCVAALCYPIWVTSWPQNSPTSRCPPAPPPALRSPSPFPAPLGPPRRRIWGSLYHG